MKQLAVTKNLFGGVAAIVITTFAVFAGAAVHKETPLKKAISDLDVQAVRAALNAGADLNGECFIPGEPCHLIPLHWVTAQLGLPEERKPPLSMHQAEEKVIEILDALLQAGARINDEDASSGGILSNPVFRGSKVVTKFLLDRGANPNGSTDEKIPPLLLARVRGFAEIEALLVQYGAEPIDDAAVSQLRLIDAASRGDVPTMFAALAKGANINEEGAGGYTALGRAILSLHSGPEAVKFILSAGADPNLGETETHTLYSFASPLHAAVSSFRWQTKPEAAREILRLLLEAGAHVSKSDDSFGMTPLHVAAQRNNPTAVKMLLEAGAKVMPKDKEGKTPLDYAESGPMIKLLKSYGAKGH